MEAAVAAAAGAVFGFAFWSFLPLLGSARRLSVPQLAVALVCQSALFAVSSIFSIPVFWLNLGQTALLAGVACVRQNVGLRMALFLAVFYGIGTGIWLFLARAAAAWPATDPSVPGPGTWWGIAAGPLVVGTLLVSAVLAYCGRLNARLASRLPGLLSAVSLIVLVVLATGPHAWVPEDTIQMWLILAIIESGASVSLSLRRQYEMEKETAALRAQQKELLEREYASIRQAYEMNATLFHDFHNHLGILRRFLDEGKVQEAKAYVHELELPTDEKMGRWTGDDAADWLIGAAASRCTAAGIDFRADVLFPGNTNIRGSDLCAVLGNLLDNAVTAAKRCTHAQTPFVHVRMRSVHQTLLIRVENSVATQKRKTQSLPRTKEDLHGWGLRSAKTAVEKYDGSLVIEEKEDTFVVTAMLCWDPAG